MYTGYDAHALLLGAEMPRRGKILTRSIFAVFFQGSEPHSAKLIIPVVNVDHGLHDSLPHCSGLRGTSVQYQLCRDDLNMDLEADIIAWASSQLNLEEDNGFQSALDNLVIRCIEYGRPEYGRPDILPHVSTGLTIP